MRLASKRAAKAATPPSLELIKQYTPLVKKIVGGFLRSLPRNVLRDDLIGAGMAGLWDAIHRNAGGPGEQFEWYLRVRIKGAILDELRAQDWLTRRARARAAETAGTEAWIPPPAVVRFDELSEADQNRALRADSSSDALVGEKEQLEKIHRCIEAMPRREKLILTQRYLKGRRLKDIAKTMKISVPRVSQLHSRAVSMLRTAVTGAPPSWRKRKK